MLDNHARGPEKAMGVGCRGAVIGLIASGLILRAACSSSQPLIRGR